MSRVMLNRSVITALPSWKLNINRIIQYYNMYFVSYNFVQPKLNFVRLP